MDSFPGTFWKMSDPRRPSATSRHQQSIMPASLNVVGIQSHVVCRTLAERRGAAPRNVRAWSWPCTAVRIFIQWPPLTRVPIPAVVDPPHYSSSIKDQFRQFQAAKMAQMAQITQEHAASAPVRSCLSSKSFGGAEMRSDLLALGRRFLPALLPHEPETGPTVLDSWQSPLTKISGKSGDDLART